MLAVLLILAAQMPDPVEAYEQRFEQRTTPPGPPTLYVPYPAQPQVNFSRPFELAPPKSEQRFIDQNGKLVTCRQHGPWVYCF